MKLSTLLSLALVSVVAANQLQNQNTQPIQAGNVIEAETSYHPVQNKALKVR